MKILFFVFFLFISLAFADDKPAFTPRLQIGARKSEISSYGNGQFSKITTQGWMVDIAYNKSGNVSCLTYKKESGASIDVAEVTALMNFNFGKIKWQQLSEESNINTESFDRIKRSLLIEKQKALELYNAGRYDKLNWDEVNRQISKRENELNQRIEMEKITLREKEKINGNELIASWLSQKGKVIWKKNSVILQEIQK